VVDKAILAAKVAAIRDAVARIGAVLPPSVAGFVGDRTAREIVVLNLFVALQECVALASHWMADEGWDVPATYGGLFKGLADHGVIDRTLAERLAAAAGLRNLVAHQYGVLDPARVYAIASSELDDLLVFAARLSELVR
jgi:uncharacterized protein YutE (UPF0331/DUF86 family)